MARLGRVAVPLAFGRRVFALVSRRVRRLGRLVPGIGAFRLMRGRLCGVFVRVLAGDFVRAVLMRRVGLGLIRLRFVRLGIVGLGLAGFRLVGLGFGVRLFRLRLAMRLFRLGFGGRRLLVTRRGVFGLRLVMGRLGRGGRRDLLRHHDLGVAVLVVGRGQHLEDRARLVAPVFDLRAGVDLDLQQHLVVAAARRRAPDEGGRVLLEP